MRRTSVTLMALLISISALPAGAVPPPEAPAAQVVHLNSSELGAGAEWSSCPAEPIAGAECTITSLSAVFVKSENQRPVREDMVLLEQRTFRFTEGEVPEPLVISSLSASGPIDLEIDRKLTAASFTATVGGQTCVRVGGEFDCQEATVDVSASWSGEGEVVASNEHATPGGGTEPPFLIVHEKVRQRAASVAASVDGAPIPGNLIHAELFDRTRSFILVCRGGPGVDPAECPAP